MKASFAGSIKVVRALIEAGTDLNLQDPWDRTDLIRASNQGIKSNLVINP